MAGMHCIDSGLHCVRDAAKRAFLRLEPCSIGAAASNASRLGLGYQLIRPVRSFPGQMTRCWRLILFRVDSAVRKRA